ncbi:MAG TPA: PaaI family thioesterase [Pseudonocardiaceae bacterium]
MDRNREYSWSDPMISAGALKGRSGLDLMRGLANGELPPPPMAKTLGFEIVEAEEGRVVLTFTPAEYHYNPMGFVHGGAVATVLDTAAAACVQTLLPAGTSMTSVDLSVKYLRPITADTGPLRAVGTVLSKGRRTALGQAELRDAAGRLVAHATGTALIFEV